jgi:hypothetical protein
MAADMEKMQTGNSGGFSIGQVIGMIVASMCIAIVCTALALKIFLFPSPFKPVQLSPEEERQLESKLNIFEGFGADAQSSSETAERDTDGKLIPEKYSEEGASRQINFTERELNAMLAKNTDLADKLAIDLADGLISLKLLIPLDPDFPVLGGKTLKVKAGAELRYGAGRPVIMLKGVSLMGIPMPNSWLGGLKNVDLVQKYAGLDEGFWNGFAQGVENISVQEGRLNIRLKE